MIFLHLLWDLDYFGLVTLNQTIYQSNIIVPTLFFLLVGICLAVNREKNHNLNKKKIRRHLIRRGLWIFCLGMVITLITLLFLSDRPIIFGVLHCIGFSIILSIPFLRLKIYNIILAVIIIVLGIIMGSYAVENPTVFHLAIGFHQAELWKYSIDYFPLFPWFGVCLLGIALGSVLYKGYERRFKIPNFSKYKPFMMFSRLGRHSLAIYLFHQPIIAGVLYIFAVLS